MRNFIWVALFLFLLLLQGTLWLILPNWLSFDLLLPAIYFFALLYGETAGFLIGLIMGLFQDCLTPGFFGFHMLTRCAIGYGIGMVQEKVFEDEQFAHLSIIGILSIGIKLFAGILIMLSSMSLRFWPSFLLDTVIYTVINILYATPLFAIIKFLKAWTGKEEELFNAVNKDEETRLRQKYLEQHNGLRYKKGPIKD